MVLSLLNREYQELIEELQKYPIGVFAREFMVNGFLSGAIKKDFLRLPDYFTGLMIKEIEE